MMLAHIFDIHCHILPGVDDGPQTMDESLEIARGLVDGGVEQVCATSHHIAGTAWSMTPDKVQYEVRQLQECLQQEGIPLILHAGMEIAMHLHLVKEAERGMLLPLGMSDYYLLEPPFHSFGEELLDVLLAFKKNDRNVILAHPERILFFQKNRGVLKDLVSQGVKVQMNIGSLLGLFGKTAKTFALDLAEQDCLHFIASDTHGIKIRTPPTKKCWAEVVQLLGLELTQKVVGDNPTALMM